MSRDADRFAHRKTQRIRRHGIHVAQNFVGHPRVVLETGRRIGDVVLRFHDGLSGIATFDFGKVRGVLPDFLGELVQYAAAFLCSCGRPRTGIKRRSRRFHRGIHIGRGGGRDLRDHFFRRRIVHGKCFAGGSIHPFAANIILIRAHHCLRTARHHDLPNAIPPHISKDARSSIRLRPARRRACAPSCVCHKQRKNTPPTPQKIPCPKPFQIRRCAAT